MYSLPAEPPEKPKNTGVGSPSLLQWLFLTQESNWGLLQCRQILYQLSYEGRPINGWESWTIKKADHWRIDAFELWCWRRLLRVAWTARRSNQSILKEISPEYSLEGLMLQMKVQYFGHLMGRTDSMEKTLMLGNIEGRKRRGQQKMRWLDGITTLWTWVWVSSRSWWCTGKPGVLQSMGSPRLWHDWATE